MTRDTIIETLKARETELRRLGVRHIALFGSAARGEAIDASDIDILVDLQPDAPIDVFAYVGLTQFIEDLFPVPVDVANHARLKPHVRPHAEREAVYAF
jgi:predicted nucleotidyltransferase